mmetsp:Transcript_39303/g.61255  ORF Transcript_39303/g.61255 Transcript_39303/m.61255 type:complete len:83 (+) Transcript_39303:236-484(+)
MAGTIHCTTGSAEAITATVTGGDSTTSGTLATGGTLESCATALTKLGATVPLGMTCIGSLEAKLLLVQKSCNISCNECNRCR